MGRSKPGDDETLGDPTRTLTLEPAMSFRPGRPRPPVGLPLPDRYLDEGFLGSGAMGEVRRVKDTVLGTSVAFKMLRTAARDLPSVKARFEAEARVTARLRHPNIIAVHDTGVLPDGRVWFTMELVEGRTLTEVIHEVHDARGPHNWRRSPGGWTLRRLIRTFAQVCEAVAYAHNQKVIHRDLKPHNIMVGAHGEVKVMDWGIARGFGYDMGSEPGSVDIVGSKHRTQVGKVIGTPAFMSPEQAWGQRDRVGPASDVYALGSVLYNILAGVAPYHGEHETAIRLVRLRAPRSVNDVIKKPAPPIPSGLTAICERALAREPEDRYPTAAHLAAALSAWLAEDTRREEALELVRRAEGLLDEAKRLDAAASALESAYKLQSSFIPSDATVEVKAVTWELERRARADRLALTRLRAEIEEHLWSALALVPALPPARTLMAQLQRDLLVEAEDRGDSRDVLERETWLRQVDDGTHAAFLQGDGRLTLHTEPAGAIVILHRWVSEDRVLIPRVLRRLGQTPLDGVTLPRGSWLLTVKAPGCAEVRVPVSIGRLEHWDRVPPDGIATAALLLPADGELAEGEVYVPGDWCIVGGGNGPDARPRSRVWCDGFVMQRVPITFGEWRDYLVDLVERGDLDEARARARPSGYRHPPLEPQAEVGAWAELTDAQAALPAHHVSRSDAEGYIAWRAVRDGLAWRLPTEIEWEHAARGADGRAYPMGPNCDPALAHLWGCREGPGRAMPIGDFPTDVSPYGVWGLTGGVCDLTASSWRDSDSGSSVAKGGNALDFAEFATAWSRRRVPARRRVMLVGLRLVRDWPDP